MDGLVSVIIPVYNGEKYIKECIDSVLKQTYRNIEIIVVHDESADNGLKIIEEYGDKIKLIKQRKTSPAIARNVGYRASKGEYISFCDIDDFFLRDKIQMQMDCLSGSPKIGAAYTDIVVVDETGEELRKIYCPEWNRNHWLSHRFVVFSSTLIKRAVIEENCKKYHQIFDESLRGCEDFDFLIRISEMARLKRCPHFLTHFRFHSESLCRNTMWRMNRVRFGIFKKYRMRYQFVRSFFVDIPMGIVSEYYISKKYTKSE